MSTSPVGLLGTLIERLRKYEVSELDGMLLPDPDPDGHWVHIDNLKAELAAALATLPQQERMFPIQGGPHVPWSIIAACESQMQANHNQSAETLARRGGLCATEAVDVLLGDKWNTCQLSNDKAITKMLEIVQERQRLAVLPPAPPQEDWRPMTDVPVNKDLDQDAGFVFPEQASAPPPTQEPK